MLSLPARGLELQEGVEPCRVGRGAPLDDEPDAPEAFDPVPRLLQVPAEVRGETGADGLVPPPHVEVARREVRLASCDEARQARERGPGRRAPADPPQPDPDRAPRHREGGSGESLEGLRGVSGVEEGVPLVRVEVRGHAQPGAPLPEEPVGGLDHGQDPDQPLPVEGEVDPPGAVPLELLGQVGSGPGVAGEGEARRRRDRGRETVPRRGVRLQAVDRVDALYAESSFVHEGAPRYAQVGTLGLR